MSMQGMLQGPLQGRVWQGALGAWKTPTLQSWQRRLASITLQTEKAVALLI